MFDESINELVLEFGASHRALCEDMNVLAKFYFSESQTISMNTLLFRAIFKLKDKTKKSIEGHKKKVLF